MPDNKSIYTQAAEEMGEEIARFRKDAEKAKPVPFMMEVSSRKQTREWFESISPQAKQEYIDSVGLDRVRKMMRGRNA